MGIEVVCVAVNTSSITVVLCLLIRNVQDDAPPVVSTSATVADIELKAYIADNTFASGGDALQWWSVNALKYPNMAVLAAKYLAMPASNAPSERVFSSAKNLLKGKRWGLDPVNLEKFIMWRHNLSMEARAAQDQLRVHNPPRGGAAAGGAAAGGAAGAP